MLSRIYKNNAVLEWLGAVGGAAGLLLTSLKFVKAPLVKLAYRKPLERAATDMDERLVVNQDDETE